MNTRNGGRGVSRDRIFVLAAISGSTLTASAAMAQGPAGEQVAAGSAAFTRNGDLTQITTSHTAIINYQSFNVAQGHTVQFIQPDATSRVLNRVLGPDPSQIAGTIRANGQVYIVNRAGVTFTNGSVIDVGGLYAAAGSIANDDFLSNIDRFTSLRGTVRNEGLIQASKAVLAGANVQNTGSINTPQGTVVFTAGDNVFIGTQGGSMYARVSGGAAGNGIANSGSVNAGTGSVIVATGDVFGMAIQHSGAIKAANAAITGGRGTYTSVSGSIDATNTAGKGGSVKVLGGTVALLDGHIDASGSTGGGQVLVGGNWQGQGPELNAQNTYVSQASTINADATGTGDGGTIVVWSDQNTAFYGSASAVGRGQNGDGGRIETSGKIWLDVAGARIAARGDEANGGTGGLWLLDPTDITISNAATNPGAIFNAGTGAFTAQAVNTATILVTDIRTALEGGFDVTISSASAGAGPGGGDITFANSLSVALGGTRTLTLLANGSGTAAINFNAGVSVVSVGAALNVVLTASDTVTLADNTFNLLGGNLTISSANGVSIGAATFQNIGAWQASANVGSFITFTGSSTFSTGITSISFGRDILGGGNALAFAAGAGSTSFSGSVTNVTSLDNQRTGAVSIGGNQTATTGAIRHAGAVTLTGDRVFTTTDQAVTFDQGITAGGALTVAAGTGTVTFGGAVTNATSIQRTGTGLTRISANQTGSNALSYGGGVELSGGDVTLSGTSVTITGSITDTAAASNLVLTGSGGGALAVNGTTVTLASLTTNGVLFSATNLATMTVTGATGVVINAGGTIQGSIDSSASNGPFNVTAGILTIDGDTTITTGNGLVSFAGAVTSTAGTEDLSISAGSGAVTFSSTLNAIGDVTLVAGSGTTTFNGTAGATSLASLTNNRTGLVTIAGDQTSVGALIHSGATGGISLTGNRAFSAGGVLTLTGNLAGTGANTLTLNGAGTTTTFGGTVSALAALTNNRGGVTNVGGNQTVAGPIFYQSGLNLNANTVFDATGLITITGAVTGNTNNLDFAAQAANTIFGSTVSTVGRLQNLRTGSTSIGGNQNTTLGALALIQHAGNVTLTANTEFNAGAGATTFGGTVNGAFNFDLVGTGTTTFSGAVGDVTPVARLRNLRTGAVQINGDQTTAGGASGVLLHTGAVTLGGAGVRILDSGVADMTFAAIAGGGTVGLTLNQTSNNGGNAPGATFLNGAITGLTSFTNNRTGTTSLASDVNVPGAFVNAGPLVFSTASTVIQAGSINLGSNLSTTANTNLVLNSVGATTLGGTLITLGSLSTDVAGGPFAFVNGGGAANTFTHTNVPNRIITLNQATGLVLNDQGVRTIGGQINTSPGNGPVNFAGTSGIVLNGDTSINTGSGAVTFGGDVSGAFNLDLLGSGTTAFNTVTGVARIDNRRTGAISFNGNQLATGLIRHDGAVTLLSTSTVTGASITFNSTIDATTAGVEALQLFSPGATLIVGNVGQTVALGAFASDAPGTLTVASIDTRGSITASDATVNLTGATYDSTDGGAAAGSTIAFNSLSSGLTTLAVNTTVTSGGSATNFLGAVRSAGANVSLATTSTGGVFGNHIGGTTGDPDAFRLLSLTVNSPLGGAAINFGDATVTDMFVRTISNIAGAININADSLLASNLTFDTRVPGNTSANIVFAGTINSTGGTPRDLTLLNQGLVDLQGTIGNLGGNARLRNILSDATFTALNGTINIEENTDVTGSIILNDGTSTVVLGDGGAAGEAVIINAPGGFIVTGANVIIADDVTIDATAAAITFGNTGTPALDDLVTINSDNALDNRNFTINSTGTKTLRGAVGFGGGRLASFSSTGIGTIIVEEGINTTGNQSFADSLLTFGDGGPDGETINYNTTTGGFLVLRGATTLADDIVIASTSGGAITFGGVGDDSATINADTTGRDFTVNTSGTAQFRGAIGNTGALETFTSDTGGSVIFEENVTTRGNILLNDTTLIGLGDGGVSDAVTISTTNGGSFQVTSGPTELRDNITINTGAAAITFGANPGAAGDTATVNGDGVNIRNLEVSTTGSTIFRGQIGNLNALGTFVSLGGGSLLVEENAATSGQFRSEDATITLGDGDGTEEVVTITTNLGAGGGDTFLIVSGATTIADDVVINAFNGNIVFGSTAPGDGSTIDADVNTRDLTVTTTTGTKTFRGAIGQTVRLASFTANGTGLTTIEENAGTVGSFSINDGPVSLGDADGTAETVTLSTQGGAFLIEVGPTTLTDNLVISTGSGNVTVNGNVNADNFINNRSLAINSSGIVTFSGAIGSLLNGALFSVTSDSAGATGSSIFNSITTRGTGVGSGIFLLDPSVSLTGNTYDSTNNGDEAGSPITFNSALGEEVLLFNDVTIRADAGTILFNGTVQSRGVNRTLAVASNGTIQFADNVGGAASGGVFALQSLFVGNIGGGPANLVIFGTNGLPGGPLAAGSTRTVRTIGDLSVRANGTTNDNTTPLGILIGADTLFEASGAGSGIQFQGFINADRRDNNRTLEAQTQGLTSFIQATNDIGFAGAANDAGNGSFASVTFGSNARTPDSVSVAQVRTTGDQSYIGTIINLLGAQYLANDNAGIGNITFGDENALAIQAVRIVRFGPDLVADRTVSVRAGTSIFFNSTIDSNDPGGNINALFTEAPQITRFAHNIGAGNAGAGVGVGRLARIVSDGFISLGINGTNAVTQFGGIALSPADLLVLTSSSNTQIYNNAILLATNTVFGDNNNGDINFNNTINGDGVNPRSMAVRTRGVTRFRNNVGLTNALDELVTDEPLGSPVGTAYSTYAGPALDPLEVGPNTANPGQNRVVFGRLFNNGSAAVIPLDLPITIQTTGQQSYNDVDGIRLADSTTFRADTGTIAFNTTINGDFATVLFDNDGPGGNAPVVTNVRRNLTVRTGGDVTFAGSIGFGDQFATAADAAASSAGTAVGLVADGFAQGPVALGSITVSNLNLAGNPVDGAQLFITQAHFDNNVGVVAGGIFRTFGNQTYNYDIVNGALFEGISVDTTNTLFASAESGNISFNGNVFATAETPGVAVRRLFINTAGQTAFNGMVGANYTRDAGGVVVARDAAGLRFEQIVTDLVDNGDGAEFVSAVGERGGTTRFSDDVFLLGRDTSGGIFNQAAGPGIAAVNYAPRVALLANDLVTIRDGGLDAKPAVPPATQALADFITPGETIINGGQGSLIFRLGINNVSANGVGTLTLVSNADALPVGVAGGAGNGFLALTDANRLTYIQNYLAPIVIGQNGSGTGIGTAASRFASVRITSNPVAFRGALDPNPNLTGFDSNANVAGRGTGTDATSVPILSTIVFVDAAAVAPNGLSHLDPDQANVTNIGLLDSAANTPNFGIYTTGSAVGNGIFIGQNEKIVASGNIELLAGIGANRGRIVISDINAAGVANGFAGNLRVGEGLNLGGDDIRIQQRVASSIVKFINTTLTVVPDQGVDYVAGSSITFSSLPIRFGAGGPFFTAGLRPQFSTVTGENVVLAGQINPPFTIRRFKNALYTSPLPAALLGANVNQFNDDSAAPVIGNLIPFDLRAEGASIIVYSDSENTVLEAVRELPYEPTVRRHNREPWFVGGKAPSRLIEEDIVRKLRTDNSAGTERPATSAAPATTANTNRNAAYTQPNQAAAGVR